MLRRLSTILALLLVCSIVLVACGGDDDDDDPTAGSDGEVATEPAPTETTDAGEEEAPTATSEPESDDTATQPAETEEPSATSSDGAVAEIVEPPPRDDSIPRDGRVLGEPDAPVSIVEYGDFQ